MISSHFHKYTSSAHGIGYLIARFRKSFGTVVLLGLALKAIPGCLQAATLTVNFSPLPGGTIDLTTQGILDWAHWGTVNINSFDHKSPATNLISNFTQIGANPLEQNAGIAIGYSWTNGTPTTSIANSTTAVAVDGLNDGFQIQTPASTTPLRLKIYAGTYLAMGRLEAHLSDNSAPDVFDFTMDSNSGATNGVYDIDFSAASSGQILTVKLSAFTDYDPTLSRVLLHSAALQPPNQLPVVSIATPTNESSFAFGTTITLTPSAVDNDGSITKVEYFDFDTKLGEATNGSFSFAWTNGAVGEHFITAVATDNLGDTNSSDGTTIYIYSTEGLLSASESTPPSAIDLSAEGTADWAHWGLFTAASFDHKAGVPQQIGNYSTLGSDQFNYSDNTEGYSWTGGTPNSSAVDTHTGVYFAGLDNGFQLSVAADTTVKTLKLYVGAFGGRGRLQAFLSDFSAPIYFDSTVQNDGTGPGGVYTINYRANAEGEALVLRYKLIGSSNQFANVTLQSATLVGGNSPPFAFIATPTNQTVVTAPANVTIQAGASDSDGTVTKVEFYQGATKLGESTNGTYAFVWTNVPAGNYSLTVRATDNQNATFTSEPVSLYVVNTGGSLSGSVTQSPAALNLSSEGLLDWGHWGVSKFNSFNHKVSGNQISGVSIVAGGVPSRYADNGVSFSWTNGTPVLATNNTTTGIFIKGLGNGFQMSVPAETKLKRVKIYLGLFAARGHFEATLSDFSAPPFIDDSMTSLFGNRYGVYTLDFSAATSNKTLIVKYTTTELFDAEFGNVTWQAATVHYPIINLRNPQKTGNQFSFVVQSELTKVHDVQYCVALPGPWLNLTSFTGTGTDVLITDPGPVGQNRFYRVLTE